MRRALQVCHGIYHMQWMADSLLKAFLGLVEVTT